jgi:hypothetical protein
MMGTQNEKAPCSLRLMRRYALLLLKGITRSDSQASMPLAISAARALRLRNV